MCINASEEFKNPNLLLGKIRYLLLFGTASSSALRLFNRGLIRLNLAAAHTHEASSGLPWSFELANSWLAEDVNLGDIALEHALQRDDRLNNERVGVLEVEVHECHHAYAHHLLLVGSLQLLLVVLHNRCYTNVSLELNRSVSYNLLVTSLDSSPDPA